MRIILNPLRSPCPRVRAGPSTSHPPAKFPAPDWPGLAFWVVISSYSWRWPIPFPPSSLLLSPLPLLTSSPPPFVDVVNPFIDISLPSPFLPPKQTTASLLQRAFVHSSFTFASLDQNKQRFFLRKQNRERSNSLPFPSHQESTASHDEGRSLRCRCGDGFWRCRQQARPRPQPRRHAQLSWSRWNGRGHLLDRLLHHHRLWFS
jgi:hypothetical protein